MQQSHLYCSKGSGKREKKPCNEFTKLKIITPDHVGD